MLGNLAAIEEALQNAADDENADKTADEYRQIVKDLEQTRDDLKQARQAQDEANREAAEDEPAASGKKESEVAAQVKAAAQDRKLPAIVKSRLAEAEAAATDAAEALEKTETVEPEQQAAVEGADEALRRAESEVQAALADAQRRALAVEIGELGRALETRERAAATEPKTAAAAKAFNVYYAKVPGATETSYTMDHTAGSYVFDAEGRIRLFTRYGAGADALVHDLEILLAQK